MKFYSNEVLPMTQEMNNALQKMRQKRHFCAADWLDQKVTRIVRYFESNNMSTAVIGLSGGIDSSVAFAVMMEAHQRFPSVVKRVVPLTLPALRHAGATHQEDTLYRVRKVCAQYDVDPIVFSRLSEVATIVDQELTSILQLPGSDWTRGQLVPYLRTPLFYNTCSLLTDAGSPALVVGTTNLSEGGYLGYVGKASDGMTDLQIISDLFKSEVYAVAQLCGLDDSVVSTVPTGDMFDGRSDEELFGVTYDFVELHHLWLMNGSPDDIARCEGFESSKERVDKLHAYNGHKYNYQMPSAFLDVMPAAIPGGWNNPVWSDN